MSQALLFTALIPLSIAAALLLASLSNRIAPARKGGIQRVLACLLYGAVAIVMAWKAVERAAEGDWLIASLIGLSAGLFAFYCLRRLRAPPRPADLRSV